MRWEVRQGDCLALAEELPDGHVDAIVTDPPYHLTQVSRGGSPRNGNPESPFGRHGVGTDRGFMGKTWDGGDIAFRPETWAAFLRVAKPGAHLLAFGGPRTFHRLACAIEDGGWEIRDTLSWVFGSGFPKSLNVAKEIDAARGFERESREPPITDEAKAWQGHGTALKPAWEPVVVARKPLSGTVASNVLGHGTGSLNIDGCRIRRPGNDHFHAGTTRASGPPGDERAPSAAGMYGPGASFTPTNSPLGGWPANLFLSHTSDCKVIGTRKVKGDPRPGGGTRPGGFGDVGSESGDGVPSAPGYGDENGEETVEVWDCPEDCAVRILDEQTGEPPGMSGGGASRFFYCAKVSRSERDEGLDELPATTGAEATDSKEGQARLNSPRTGAGRTGGARNAHPTLKPVDLMRWLVRLVGRKDALVLDPFAGSGSTGIAALMEQMRFLGFEREDEYVKIARARLVHASGSFEAKQLGLF